MKADEVDAELVERVARVLWLAQTDHESAAWDRAAGLPIEDDWREFWRETARAALAAVIPEVQRRERERCAEIAERIVITHARQTGERPFFSARATAAAIRTRTGDN